MTYQNLLARAAEVPREVVRETARDLAESLRDEEKSSHQRVVEGMVRRMTKPGVSATQVYHALKEARRDELLETPVFKMMLEGPGSKELMKSSQVDTGVAGKFWAPYDLFTPHDSVETGQNAPSTGGNKGPVLDPSKIRRVRDLRKVAPSHAPETEEEDMTDPFPGETIAQAVGRIQTVLSLYPTAPRFGIAGPHPGLCRGNPESCEACGFAKEPGEHCHRYEVCSRCLGIGDGSCSTAQKMEAYGETKETK